MANIDSALRLPNETEYAYIWRLGEAKTQGTLDLTWDEIATLINTEFREDESDFRSESAYRKQYQTSKLFFEQVFSQMEREAESDPFRLQKDELFKLKKQFYDQRREYNKLLTADARWEHLVGEVGDAARSLNESAPLLTTANNQEGGDNDAVLILSDWHYGMVSENVWNRYGVDVFKKRLDELMAKVVRYIKRHNPRVIHVAVLGDVLDGAIRVTTRIESEERTVEQLMHVSEYIAEIASELSNHVPSVKIYTTYGNHARVVQDKRDSIHADNLERLIPWWVEQRLANNPNVEVVNGDMYEFLHIKACDSNIIGVHGDLDARRQSSLKLSQLFSRKYGISVDTIIQGHIHHTTADEDLGVEVITVGSMCGTDEYANINRLYSLPSQTLLFFADGVQGKECRYDINFSDGKEVG